MQKQGIACLSNRVMPQQHIAALLVLVILGVNVLVSCGTSQSTLSYFPTGTPTPRPDTLYLLSYIYAPGQPIYKSAKAWRIVDSAQVQHFYNLMNALPPEPLPVTSTNTSSTCSEISSDGNLLFFLQGQPTLEVTLTGGCLGMVATLTGFIPGNPPKFASLAGEERPSTPTVIGMVQQAYLLGTPIPVQDIPYQPIQS